VKSRNYIEHFTLTLLLILFLVTTYINVQFTIPNTYALENAQEKILEYTDGEILDTIDVKVEERTNNVDVIDIKNIFNSTAMTVNDDTSGDATEGKDCYTVLYSDGLLVINQPAAEIDERVEDGSGITITGKWEPLDENNKYEFDSYNKVVWKNSRNKIKFIKFGSTTGITNQIVKPTSMAYWFYNCYSLTDFDSTNLDTSNVTDMSYMFYNAGSSAFILDLADWNTSSVTNMSYMFGYAGSRAKTFELDLSNWDTGSVTNMSYMFGCAGYVATTFNLDISSWNTSRVIDMSGMFNCAGTKDSEFDIDLSNWDVSSVINMGAMFAGAGENSKTFTLDLSEWDTSSVVDMGAMFSGAGENSKTFTLDLSAWDTSHVTDVYSMFSSAGSSATTFTLNLSNWEMSSVTNMSYMFNQAGQNSTSWSVEGLDTWNVSAVNDASMMFYNSGRYASTINIDLSSWDVGNIINMKGMFGCFGDNSKEVNIGTLSNWDTGKVTDMSAMFWQFANNTKTATDIGSFLIPAGANIEYFASGADTLSAEITISGSVASYKYTFYHAATKKDVNKNKYLSDITIIPATDTIKMEVKTNIIDKYGLDGTEIQGNIHFPSDCYTVLYSDGLLVINQSEDEIEQIISSSSGITIIKQSNALDSTNTYEFTSYSSVPWYTNRSKIKVVMFGSATTDITMNTSIKKVRPTSMAYWFYNCYNLTDFDSTNLDTSNVTDMSYMFYYAGSDATTFALDLSSWNTCNVIDMKGMFEYSGYGATNWILKGLSNWKTDSVTDMSYMFDNAGYKATTWAVGDLSSWETGEVTDMLEMFSAAGASAESWTVGDISNWDTSKVTNMSSMFFYSGFDSTTWSVGDLSSWETGEVTDMSHMFNRAGYSATAFSLDLSKWNTEAVTNMQGMFYYAGQVATNWNIGELSDWQTGAVTDMSYMFHSAGYKANTWRIGDLSDWDTHSVTNMSYMFYYAGQAATSWSIGEILKWDTHSVKDMSHMFHGAGSNASTYSLDLSNWDTSAVINMEEMFFSVGFNAATFSLNVSNWKTGAVTDMKGMFGYSGCKAETWSIVGLETWDTSKVTDMSAMFAGAGENAKTIDLDLSDWKTSSVVDMSSMFSCLGGNANEVSIGSLSNWDTRNVDDMSCMFYKMGENTDSDIDIGTLTIQSGTNLDSFAAEARTLTAEITILGDVSSDTASFYNAASKKIEDKNIYIPEITLIMTEDEGSTEIINTIIDRYGLSGSVTQGNIIIRDSKATGTTGTISPLTEGGLVDGNKISFEYLTLELKAADNDAGITQDGWSYGFRIKAPEVVNSTSVPRIKYTTSDTGSSTESFNNNGTESECYMDFWLPITIKDIEDALAGDGLISGTLRFDWNGDGEVDQTFTYSVDVKNITLLGEDKDGDGKLETEFQVVDGVVTVRDGKAIDYSGKLSAITEGGTVEGDKLTFSNLELKYTEATDGKDAGWWVGAKITASPSIDIENVVYSITETDEKELSFKDNKTGEDEDGNYYMDCWIKVTPEDIEKSLAGTGELTYTYIFDWTGNGKVDQELKIAIDASNITLYDKDGSVEFKVVDGVVTVRDGESVDYSKVYDALAKIPDDLSIYTEETVKVLEEARDAVDYTKTVDEQDEVDAMAERIEQAIKDLVEKPKADYSKVDEALSKVPEDLSYYTDETAKELQAAMDAVIRDLPFDQQDKVDEMAEKIKEAIEDLVEKPKADYSKVDEALSKVPEDLSYYTDETAKELQAAMDSIIRDLPADRQDEVDEMAKKIEEALKDLVEKPKADYSKVDEALSKVPEDLSYYTDETAKELQEAMDAVIRDLPFDQQDKVDEMTEKIKEAIEDLVEKPKADYSKVDEALKKVPTDLTGYTEETAKALKDAMDSVIRDLPADRQDEVDEMAKKIEEALKNLEKKPKEESNVADYTAVDEALKKVPTDLTGYTDETAKVLKDAMDSIIRDLPVDRQDEVDEMASKLEEALKDLEEKSKEESNVADYTAVDEALKKVPTDLTGYTDETAKVLQDAMDAVICDLPFDQQDKVDEMAEKIKEAIEDLVEKPKADYSKVDEALKKVPTDLTGYTDETAKALKDAMDSIIRDLPADQQDEVDEMASKLESAIESLVKKNTDDVADYSVIDEALKKVPTDLSGYTEESAEALKKVIESLDYSKSADEQDEVDLMLEKLEAAIKALAPIKTPTTNGVSTVITRYAGSNRYLTAQAIADGLLERLITKFDVIIVASGINYADALAGSYLSYVNSNAPIILVNSANEALVKQYITKNLNIGGKVYILGGTGVVSQGFETSITKIGSFTVKRLAGQNRYLTNLEILKETGVDKSYTGELLICTGTNYADSLSASAVDKPMLLVNNQLMDVQKTYLASIGSQEVIIFGGTGAVTKALETSLGKTVKARLAGANRFETSVMVAETFFGEKATGQAVTNISLAYGLDFPDGLAGGPLSRALNAPLLLVAENNETGYKYAIEYIKDKTLANCSVFGGTGVISDALVTKVLS
jgi:surface protein